MTTNFNNIATKIAAEWNEKFSLEGFQIWQDEKGVHIGGDAANWSRGARRALVNAFIEFEEQQAENLPKISLDSVNFGTKELQTTPELWDQCEIARKQGADYYDYIYHIARFADNYPQYEWISVDTDTGRVWIKLPGLNKFTIKLVHGFMLNAIERVVVEMEQKQVKLKGEICTIKTNAKLLRPVDARNHAIQSAAKIKERARSLPLQHKSAANAHVVQLEKIAYGHIGREWHNEQLKSEINSRIKLALKLIA